MFEPNLVGAISTLEGYDVHAREIYSPVRVCPFAIVNLEVGAEKTSVRADSSASRGSADEMTVERGKILIANYVDVKINDRFDFDGVRYKIISKFARRSVDGKIDHYECDLEIVAT